MSFSKYKGRYDDPSYSHYLSLIQASRSKLEKTLEYKTRITIQQPVTEANPNPTIYLSYRYNNILALTPNTVQLINTSWYSTNTTRNKLARFCPFYFSINSQAYSYFGKRDYLDLSYSSSMPEPNFNFELINGRPELTKLEERSYIHFIPLTEGLTFSVDPTTKKVGIPELSNCINKVENLFESNSNLYVSTFKDIFFYAVKKNKDLVLVLDTDNSSYYKKPKFAIYDKDTKRLQQKLTYVHQPLLRQFRDLPLFNTYKPYLIKFEFKGKSDNDPINKLKLLDSILCATN